MCVYVFMYARMHDLGACLHHSLHVEVRGELAGVSSLIPSHRAWVSNVSRQTSWQAPSPTESAHYSGYLFIYLDIHATSPGVTLNS